MTTPEELKAAVESDGGIAGVRVACIPGPTKANEIKAKWEGISSYYNLTFLNEGVKAFKAYSIGEGKFWPWSKFESNSMVVK